MARELVLLGLIAAGVDAQEHWRNPEIFRVNKEPAHAEFIVCDGRADAILPLDISNPWNRSAYQSLNGEWEFNWYSSVDKVPADWSNAAEWGTIPVPGCWQTYGHDRLYYTNTEQPFWFNYNNPGGKWQENFSGREELMASARKGFLNTKDVSAGCYRKWVDVPAERLDGRVVLRIGGVEAGIGIYVNGKEVGYSQDSMTPAEFNLAPYLKPGKNLIGMMVYRWTDGSYLEIQDMVRFAGIHRDVFLRFEPEQRIEDLYFVGTPSADLKTVDAVYEVDVEQAPIGASVEFELMDGFKTVDRWSAAVPQASRLLHAKVSGSRSFNGLKPWSPEQPNLYTLVATLKEASGTALQTVRIDAGFRRFEDREGNLHLNGQRFFIRGVNRHDHHPKLGRQVTVESMIRDLELMKRSNINTVRTSHYPNDERWYYLCNRYGMALIDEANLESHAISQEIPGNHPQWIPQSVDRMVNLVERDKNHPAVFIWSLGNEQGQGWDNTFDAQYDAAKAIDPTRLVMCDRGNDNEGKRPDRRRSDKPDAITPMYGALSQMERHVQKKNEKRPFFLCEYRHAMGNAVGALKEVWDYIYEHEERGLNGGCIWDWVDQGVEAVGDDGTVYYQYGGDWNDWARNTGNFCLNGLVLPNRTETPKLAEVKKCYEPVFTKALSLEDGRFEIFNRHISTDLSAFTLEWDVRENGRVAENGRVENLTAKPGEKQIVQIPITRNPSGGERILRMSYQTREAQPLVPAGHEVTFAEFKLGGEWRPNQKAARASATYTEDDQAIVVRGGDAVYTFSKAKGTLVSLKVGGTELMAPDSEDRHFDHDLAMIDNYVRHWKLHLKEYDRLKLRELAKVEPSKVSAAQSGKPVVVQIRSGFRSSEGAGFDEEQTWTIDGAGQAALVEKVSPAGALGSEVWIPRMGVRFQLAPTLDRVSYYGLGPHGNYVDRSTSAWTGIHENTVMGHYVPYAKPQDHGNREQVRWMQLSDADGRGLRVIAPEPLAMSVLPYTQAELAKARHTVKLPNEPTATELRIAAGVSGVGNGSCGPPTMEKYQVLSAPVEYRFMIMPFAAN
ncbi:glycoside hydrolase family 2 TIM barrel-domain containing protein [Pontiella desulfatans]|nr:glycoside hydrolase family 2 TIM barrel-domain containing protein [Pontiella desulfatans]